MGTEPTTGRARLKLLTSTFDCDSLANLLPKARGHPLADIPSCVVPMKRPPGPACARPPSAPRLPTTPSLTPCVGGVARVINGRFTQVNVEEAGVFNDADKTMIRGKITEQFLSLENASGIIQGLVGKLLAVKYAAEQEKTKITVK